MIRWWLIALLTVAAGPRSGYDDASPETRAMQDDDAANPAFLWVEQGEQLWSAQCSGCHGPIGTMRGVAARYPAPDPRSGRPVTVEQRINLCRVDRMGVPALRWDDDNLLALSAAIGLRSRRQVLNVAPDPALAATGEALFRQRMGQLNLSCAQCHDDHAGQKLAGSTIPQGHANAYPAYRLEWQGMGSFYRRLRNCMTGTRAEPFAPDAPEVAALAHYLAIRARGLTVETPGVRP